MHKNPDIFVSEKDSKALYALIENLADAKVGDLLIEELDRAEILPELEMPADVVKMNSLVTFTVSATGKTFVAKLAYPGNSSTENAISVLSPVGSALLGLSTGQTIQWPINNKLTDVTIKKVCNEY